MTTLINGALPQPKQIRFVNNQGQPPSKRRRINAAYVLLCFWKVLISSVFFRGTQVTSSARGAAQGRRDSV
jgi:hypothetical protein